MHICADRITLYASGEERLSTIRFVFRAAVSHSNREYLFSYSSRTPSTVVRFPSGEGFQSRFWLTILWSQVKRRWKDPEEQVAWPSKRRARESRSPQKVFSLSLSLSKMWLRKFKLPSHKGGIKSLRERRSFAKQKALTGEAFLSSFSLRILARPLTEFDHLSARCDSQKK